MKLLLKIIVAFLVMVVVVVVAIALYVDAKYGVLFESPRVSQSDLVTSNGAIRLSIDPSHMLPYVGDYFEGIPDVPEWIPPLFVPYEMGAIIDVNQETEQVEAMLYINERRLGPVILEYANRLSMHTGFTFLKWDPEEMYVKQDGLIVAEGTMDIDSGTKEGVWLLWNQSRTLAPLQLSGGHFIELLLDNRSAGAYVALSSFLPSYDIETEDLHEDDIVDMISQLKEARLVADFKSKSKIAISASFVFREEDLDDYSLSFKLLADLIIEAIQEQLQRRFDVTLTAETKWNKNVLEGDFVLEDFPSLLNAILGMTGETAIE